jgi:hypothetical protein
MLLTNDERRRFIEYLERDALSNQQLVSQMEQLGPAMMTLAKRYKDKISAALLIADDLRRVELQTITKENEHADSEVRCENPSGAGPDRGQA